MGRPGAALRAVAILLGANFVFFASLQFNDPDPARWVAVYGAAALVCLRTATGRPAPRAALVLALVTLGWAAALAPDVFGYTSWAEMTATWKMNGNPAAEEGRE